MNKKSRILILVEGAKTDVKLMEHLLHMYGIDSDHEVISYNTNIYTLYNEMFSDGDPYSIDLLQLLKERESDPVKKKIFDVRYSDIILIFDLDPQDPLFSNDKVEMMIKFFNESSDMGKLYFNYPMVEAFYHMKSIPDENYNDYIASLDELNNGKYKQRVNLENRNHNYSKFAVSREECNMVIKQNIDKAWKVTETERPDYDGKYIIPELAEVLRKQLSKIEKEAAIFVLCTCIFYIVDYNPRFINE